MMIDVETALSIVLEQVRPVEAVEMDLSSALWRTLARPVINDIDQPPFDRSLMDGYAIKEAQRHEGTDARRGDVKEVLADDPPLSPLNKVGGQSYDDAPSSPLGQRDQSYEVIGQVAAGEMPQRVLQAGQALQINTGAPIPMGTDAVVRVELTELSADGKRVAVSELPKAGQFITRRGTYRKAGECVLAAGDLLTPSNIGVAASAGAARVQVYRQPRVVVMVTGNELVEVGQRPTGGEIRNSNQYILEALIRSAHCEPLIQGIVEDDPVAIETGIRKASECDSICITGGVSMGAFDFVPQALKAVGAEVHFHKLPIKPGRPTLFATMPGGQLVFALPGNPVSAFVGFYLLVAPAMSALQGRRAVPRRLCARLRGSMGAEGDRQAYYPASMTVADDGEYEVRRLSWHGSGDALGMAGAQALIERPGGSPAAGDGDRVRVIPLA